MKSIYIKEVTKKEAENAVGGDLEDGVYAVINNDIYSGVNGNIGDKKFWRWEPITYSGQAGKE